MTARVFWGFVLVLIGGFLLAANLGLLTWDIWATLWRAWPVLLVLWGVSILLRPLGRPGGFITAALALITAVAVLGYAYLYPATGEQSAYDLSQALEEGVENVTFDLGFGAGTVTVDGAAGENLLASGRLEYITAGPAVDYSVAGSSARLSLSFASGRWSVPVGARPPSWTVHLSPAPVYTVKANLGACDANLDFTGLTVTGFNLKTGAASTTVAFGNQEVDLSAQIDIGAASLALRLPREVGVKISMSSGLTDSNLQQVGFVKNGDDWFSPDYDEKSVRFSFQIKAGVSSVNVHWTG